MTVPVYIDVPLKYPYKWGGNRTVVQCLALDLGLGSDSVRFVCNNLAGISTGDVYEITLKDDLSTTMFLLTNDFAVIPNERVAYLRR